MSGRSPKEIIGHALEQLGLSQKQFAKLVGVDPATVNRWLKGTQIPRGSIVAMIARTADIDVDDLWRAINAATIDENRLLKRELALASDIILRLEKMFAENAEVNRRILAKLERAFPEEDPPPENVA